MSKRELIMDTYEGLIQAGLDKSTTVRDIAQQANIALGGLYYHFKNKEDLLDAVLTRFYQNKIAEIKKQLSSHPTKNNQEKLILIYTLYHEQVLSEELSDTIHDPEHAYIHRKSQTYIFNQLSSLFIEIISEGVASKEFICENVKETVHLLVGTFVFILDKVALDLDKESYSQHFLFTLYNFEHNLGLRKGALLQHIK